MRSKSAVIVVLFLISNYLLLHADLPETFSLNTSDLDRSDINFELSNYELTEIIEDGSVYTKIRIDDSGEFAQPGKPDLPRFTHLIAIPDVGEVELQIAEIDEQIIENITVYPRQDLLSESQRNDLEFAIDTDFYRNGDIFPTEQVVIGDPAILRDIRIVSVTVNPFRYDPQKNELHIIKNIRFIVETSGRGGTNTKLSSKKRSRFFEPLYKSVILNYNDIENRNDDFQIPSYLFIYPNNTQVYNNLQDLVEWKHEKGFIVNSVSTLATGSNSNQILNYISNAYETWENPPEFVCLVGDAGGSYNIPTGYCGGGEGDHYYTMLDGNDILSDIYIGRLSFNTITEFQTILSKIINYEKTPYIGYTGWFEKAILVGDPNSSGPSTVDTKMHVKDVIMSNYPDFDCTEAYSGSFVNHISTNINSGVSYFNYRGYGGMSGWNTYNVNNLSNGFMLPVAVAITCNTGDFAGTYDCISEAFLKAGTPSIPKGAIAAVSTATGQTHTCFNNCMDAGIYYGLFADSLHFMGGALNRGKLNLFLNYPDNPSLQVTNFSYWNNLMGDPGLQLWTSVPQNFVVDYDITIPAGSNFMEISVENELEEPVVNAWVTILKGDDDIFETGFTDDLGQIIFPLADDETGEIKITVTKQDFIPHSGTFTIAQEEQFVNILEVIIDDDNDGTSSGNGDGFANPGEDLELSVSLKNFGSLDVEGITAFITSNNEYITITDDEEIYGNISAGAITFSDDDFDIHVSASAPGGDTAVLNLTIIDADRNQWSDLIYVQIAGAVLDLIHYEIYDSNNNIIEPGESAQLNLTISNIGITSAEEIYGTLSCDNYHVDISDDLGFFGTILPGENASNISDLFEISVSTLVLIGTQIPFDIALFNSNGFSQHISLLLEIGEVSITDPLGPDVFGYYCYDEEDIHFNAPDYNWIEISPDLGGPGIELVLNDWGNMGDIEDVDLPFIFRFYDEEYNNATVCSNGWICPGTTENESFMNWSIPGPLGPSPLIAPFWDDLIPSNGDVSYYFDNVNHIFIVEWNNMRNQYNNAEETFQVIIYDLNYFPTSNNNNKILFQYKIVNNVDQGQYSGWMIEHGQYATVGLEDHTSTIGLEYTFNNIYPTAAKPLENESALLFTGPPIYQDEPFLVIGGLLLEDENENGLADYGETIDLFINLSNLGNNSATGVSAMLVSEDEYININSSFSDYPEISGGGLEMNQNPFSFLVSSNCPDGHVVQFFLQVNSSDQNWGLHFSLTLNAPEIVFSSLLINDGDNNILDPGETSDVIISLINPGGASVYNGTFSITTDDEYLTLNENTFEIANLDPGSTTTGILNVTASESAEIGHLCSVSWTFESDLDYSASGQFQIVISQVPVNLEEDFGVFPPEGWSISTNSNWTQGTWNQAGGTPPEAQFNWYPQSSGNQRLMSPPLNTLGSLSLDLIFKHSVSHFTGTYDLLIQTSSDGVVWNTAHSFPAANIAPTTENITISTPDVGSDSFQLAFCFSGDSYNINNWWIDDVQIQSSESTLYGYLIGTITLNAGDGQVEQVIISAGNYTINPDEYGEYILPLPTGIYDVSAELNGYATAFADEIEILQLETTELDLELVYLIPPDDLEVEVIEDDVYLFWEISEPVRLPELNEEKPGIKISDFKRDIRNRTITGFNVYRDENIIYEILDPEETSYVDRELPNGEYSYYVTAQYEEGESVTSNEVIAVIDYNSTGQDLIPIRTELLGNYPNPFNPVTTISFSLIKDSERVNLSIYNMKGQLVTSLIDEPLKTGFYNVVWDGKDILNKPAASGIYFYTFRTKEYVSTGKMILLQ